MNEIVPNRKFVPEFARAAAPNVATRTGISAYAFDVNSSTSRIIPAATAVTVCISFASCAEESLPTVLDIDKS